MGRTSDRSKYDGLIKFIQRYCGEFGFAPTYDEMMAGAGLSSKCIVSGYLKRLHQDGLVMLIPGKSRTVLLTEKGKYYPGRPPQRVAAYVSKAARIRENTRERKIPLPVVGRTFAGKTTPIPNSDFSFAPDYTIEVSEGMLPPRPRLDHYFVLEVSGDSMIDAGIYDGDYVICRKAETATNGEMAVVLLTDKDETTLKYFHKENGHVRLQPANETMEPIIIHDASHLIVQGVVVQVVHCRE